MTGMIQNVTDQRHILDGGQKRTFVLPPRSTVQGEIPAWVWTNRGLHALKVQGRVQVLNRPDDVQDPIPPKEAAAPSADVVALTAQVAALTTLVEQLIAERQKPTEPAPVPGGRLPKG